VANDWWARGGAVDPAPHGGPDLGGLPWIAAHRGASASAPENTLEALHLAIEQRASLAEVDLHLTADGALALCHDPDLDRVAGAALVIEREPLARLREAYPALTDLSAVFAELPPTFPLNLELKRREASPVALAEALVRHLPGRRQVLVSSFDHELLAIVHAFLPRVPLAPLARKDPQRLLACADRLGAWGLHVSRRLVCSDLLERACLDGRPVLVYTVDDAVEAHALFAAGVAGVFTNRPGTLRDQLRGSPELAP
jgi:glycerophosphoryl diester phosphodiesterase